MLELPEEAVQAAAEALAARSDHPPAFWQTEARSALEAAMPVLEKHMRREFGEWLIRFGKRALKDDRNATDTDGLMFGWAGGLIGAGVFLENGYPERRGGAAAQPEETTDV